MPRHRVTPAILLLPVLAAIIVLAGCGGGAAHQVAAPIDPNSPREWTVLVYMASDNNLEQSGIEDINEMEAIGSTSQVSVVVQVDRAQGYDSSNGDWTTTRRYLITKDANPALIGSEMLGDLGELNMADPATLRDFVQWGALNYPAQHYMLVLWDHGSGWESRSFLSTERRIKAINQDAASGNAEMTLPQLEQSLAAAPHTDIVLFDACLMGMLEVAYSIRDSADYMVASEENVPATGQPYRSVISRMTSNPAAEPRALASVMVGDYVNYYSDYPETFTMSALDLSAVGELVSATDSLAAAMTTMLGTCGPAIRASAEAAQHYDFDHGTYRDYRDLYDFAQGLRDSSINVILRSAASGVMSAVNNAVIVQRSSGANVANSHGVSIYLPTPATRAQPLLTQYSQTSFGRDTRWDEFLAGY